jgi:hypothetical protein
MENLSIVKMKTDQRRRTIKSFFGSTVRSIQTWNVTYWYRLDRFPHIWPGILALSGQGVILLLERIVDEFILLGTKSIFNI